MFCVTMQIKSGANRALHASRSSAGVVASMNIAAPSAETTNTPIKMVHRQRALFILYIRNDFGETRLLSHLTFYFVKLSNLYVMDPFPQPRYRSVGAFVIGDGDDLLFPH